MNIVEECQRVNQQFQAARYDVNKIGMDLSDVVRQIAIMPEQLAEIFDRENAAGLKFTPSPFTEYSLDLPQDCHLVPIRSQYLLLREVVMIQHAVNMAGSNDEEGLAQLGDEILQQIRFGRALIEEGDLHTWQESIHNMEYKLTASSGSMACGYAHNIAAAIAPWTGILLPGIFNGRSLGSDWPEKGAELLSLTTDPRFTEKQEPEPAALSDFNLILDPTVSIEAKLQTAQVRIQSGLEKDPESEELRALNNVVAKFRQWIE